MVAIYCDGRIFKLDPYSTSIYLANLKLTADNFLALIKSYDLFLEYFLITE